MKKTGKKTLSAPLRVYWDLSAGPDALPRALAADVARELASMKVFFVTVRLAAGLRNDVGGILSLLKEGGARVTVSIGDVESFPGADALSMADAVDLCPADAAGLKRLLVKADRGKPLSVSMVPGRDNVDALMGIMSAALDAGVKTFNLSNPCLVYDRRRAREFVMGASQRDELKRGLERLLRPLEQGIKLFVHDLFLHKSLRLPGLPGRIEYAGCQAGDAIMYIDGSGTVYPCATMPIPLGSLNENSLKEIWADARRGLLRDRIESLPEDCAGCSDAPDCKGGCRGLAWEVGGGESMDPSCGKYTGLV